MREQDVCGSSMQWQDDTASEADGRVSPTSIPAYDIVLYLGHHGNEKAASSNHSNSLLRTGTAQGQAAGSVEGKGPSTGVAQSGA
jgi:hypothetical protein